MSFATWLMSCFSRRGKALSLYRTGMAKAEKRDYEGAIADYSTAIELAKIPADVKAMALYNRCARYQAIREDNEIERGSCGRIGNARIARIHQDGGRTAAETGSTARARRRITPDVTLS